VQGWRTQKRVFATIATGPVLWLLLFFIIPLAVLWAYSFGRNVGLTEIEISGTFANYAKAIEPLYLQIFGKSIAVAALTTFICLIVGFPVALAITFATPKYKPWLLLGSHAAVLDQPFDPHLCADGGVADRGLCQSELGQSVAIIEQCAGGAGVGSHLMRL